MYKIKQKPEDFYVEEIMDINLDGGDYTYFILEKNNLNTHDALKIIAKALRINDKRFNIAGIKDKNAITKQYVSVFKVKWERLERLKFKNIKIRVLGKGSERLMLGQLKGNRFKIVVRNLDKQKKGISFVENYFDEQRFGGRNHLLGKALVKKEFRKAVFMLRLNFNERDYIGALRKLGRKMLRFYVNAYQSLLFNDFLKIYIKENSKRFKEIDYFVFSEKRLDNIKIPIVGFLTKFDNKDVKRIYSRILKEEGINLEDFMIKQIPEISSEGNERNIIVDINNLEIKYMKDEINKGKLKAILEFELGKGSYGTLVVKKMFG
jgi:tRNA pseudouridine13 synthase